MTDLDEIPTFEARNDIRRRLRLILETIDAPVTAKLNHDKSEVPWSVENIAMALRLMARDGQCKAVNHERKGEWYAHNRWKAPKCTPVKREEPIPLKVAPAPQAQQPEEAEVKPMSNERTPIDRALDELEIKLRGRSIVDFDRKDAMLARLADMMPPDVGNVLREIRGDLKMFHKAA